MALKKFLMIGVVAGLLVACGDEASDKSPVQVAEESSSSVDEVLSSSVNVEESSSSFESEGLSSSVESGASSSSEKSTESSSGKNTEPAEVSSCSVAEGSSSSMTVEPSSSSVKIEQSSSSEKAEASSSSVKVQESSSSVKVEESSSSAKTDASSSSEKPAESSSSEKIVESSSSEASSSSVIQPCKTATEDNCIYGTLLDKRDGHTYKTVKIGTQEWMAENLATVVESISNTSYRSFCLNNTDSCAKYGRYYTWAAAIDSIFLYDSLSLQCGYGKECTIPSNIKIQGICPDGWHIPNQKEWESLINFVGNTTAGKKLKSVNDWTNWNGDDSYGFTVLPSGYVSNGSISGKGGRAIFWLATDDGKYDAKDVEFNFSKIKKDEVLVERFTKDTFYALPIRCIKD